ncbi:putative baseplate assembly protein [Leptolyngbya ohadii]|uniref:putative baseplate assembly protein n=1 Tax=Leptolyngbya ohadii TaxID=1962290 RepID=UPI000B59D76E|nr:putative baseplate assembly protein [Leptolyngbya ohadii]
MPIRPPALDDRSFDDLVEDLLSRIPAHTPEWSNPRPGDPGRTLIDLFAWLADTLLYRANLIPEKQRLTFLRLLGIPMRPAIPATGLVSLHNDTDTTTEAIVLQPFATLTGPVNFETLTELSLLPMTAECYFKRPLMEEERSDMTTLIAGLEQVYRLPPGTARPYATSPIFANSNADFQGFDLVKRTVDGCLWMALLAANRDQVAAVKATLGQSDTGGRQLLNVGIMPGIQAIDPFTDNSPIVPIPLTWEISSFKDGEPPNYLTLDVIADSTQGLTRRGVMRLALPAASLIQSPTLEVQTDIDAGVGDRPPRLDMPEKAERLVAWLRLRPTVRMESLALSWVGINAVEIDQRQTFTNRIIGQSNGAPQQEFILPGQSVDAASLEIQVEMGEGFRPWQAIDDLAIAGRDPVFQLDSEAGTIRFGDGVRGLIPEAGKRIRVVRLRSGGGSAGNLAPATLTAINARRLNGDPVARLKVIQSLPTDGGVDAETPEEAEQRIPSLFRHRDRAVTETDYKTLAAATPGLRVGRVEILPRFKPHQRLGNIPGVVSVMVLPFQPTISPPSPRPDRPFLETVHRYLEARRPLGTELYVIGCQYVPLGISVGITVRNGASQETVLNNVRESLRRFLWALPPGGTEQQGWMLGKTVRDRELEIIVSQVAGVNSVSGINLFTREGEGWSMVPRPDRCLPVELALQAWELPELLSVVAVVDDRGAPEDLRGVPNPFASAGAVAVPVVPEVC